MTEHPFGLPKGTMRAAFMTYMLVFSSWMYAMGKGDLLPSWWDALLAAQLAVYLGSRFVETRK